MPERSYLVDISDSVFLYYNIARKTALGTLIIISIYKDYRVLYRLKEIPVRGYYPIPDYRIKVEKYIIYSL
jgi:hypothetical protein